MIQYNPRDWFGLIFKFHESDTFRTLFWVIVSVAVFSWAVIYLELELLNMQFSSTIMHTLLGFVISLLLVFRTNTAYERWWEGRKQWGALVNVARNYTFKVKAANIDGIWNKAPLEIRLHISTPWWKTWWFRSLVVLAILGSIFSFYQYRVRQIRKAERLRSEYGKKLANVELTALRAQMNPHFIFNCLNSIDHYIIKNETRKASEYLNSFSRLIRLILQNSRSNYVNLRDELEALKLYMEMESLRFNHRFDYVVQVENDMDLDSTEIPPMIIQPYVENAIWHGLMHKEGKGKVVLTLARENGYLRCSIEDNGIGRARAAELKSRNSTRKKSMGMGITNDRINIINNLYNTDTSVKVIDLVNANGTGRGTRIELTIPI